MKKILLIEDSMTDAFNIKSMLSADYHVTHLIHANNILDDVKILKPDLILMDIILPGVSGFQAIRKLKQCPDTRHLPMIVCSSKSIEADRIWAQRNGADEYIVKPVTKQGLIGKVAGILRNKAVGQMSVACCAHQ